MIHLTKSSFLFFSPSVIYSLGQVLYLKALFQLEITFSPLYTNTSIGVQVQSMPDMNGPGDLLSLLESSTFSSTVKINNCKDS